MQKYFQMLVTNCDRKLTPLDLLLLQTKLESQLEIYQKFLFSFN